jgi:GT2 family glycosyltransferase
VNDVDRSLANPPRVTPGSTTFEVPSSTGVDGLRLPVYVIHWDAPEWCAATVRSLMASTGVIVDMCVVDNGPADASARLRSSVPAGVRFIDPGTNTGFAGAANLAGREWLAADDSPFAIIASHDLRLRPESFSRMISILQARQLVGIVGPEYGRLGEPSDNTTAGHVVAELTPWISGSCLAVRRECLAEVGPFDERLGSYVEDVDICFRAWDAGWEVARVTGMAMGWNGSRSESARTYIDANWMLLALKRAGPVAALRLAVSLVRPIARNLVGSLALGRPRQRRRDSRDRAMARARAYPRAVSQIRRWGTANWRSQRSVPPSWQGASEID